MQFWAGDFKRSSLTTPLLAVLLSLAPTPRHLLPYNPLRSNQQVKMQVLSSLFVLAAVTSFTAAQTHQRLGGCPDLGCVFPPDQYVYNVTSIIQKTPWKQTDNVFSTTTLGPTSLLASSSIFVSRSTPPSTAPRPALVNLTLTLPSQSPRRVMRLYRLRSSSNRMSLSWSAGTSAGTRVRRCPSVVFGPLSNQNRSLR